eukprot:TRINITY_DN3100_c0_g1_i2.p1 TRINITY_DN3100_c0_g1~~TRINITY_DN3100_c0_g1_i2.p1  ORF type:complete len:1157 (-),score=258.67 TRINITY_DN3100_c0_g1_i2:1727-5197(-)
MTTYEYDFDEEDLDKLLETNDFQEVSFNSPKSPRRGVRTPSATARMSTSLSYNSKPIFIDDYLGDKENENEEEEKIPDSFHQLTREDFENIRENFLRSDDLLSFSDFLTLFQKITQISVEELRRVFRQIDGLNRGKISFGEFISWCLDIGLNTHDGRIQTVLKRQPVDPRFCHHRSIDTMLCVDAWDVLLSCSKDGNTKIWDLANVGILKGNLQPPTDPFTIGNRTTMALAPNVQIGHGRTKDKVTWHNVDEATINNKTEDIVQDMQKIELLLKGEQVQLNKNEERLLRHLPGYPQTDGVPIRYTPLLREISRPNARYNLDELRKIQSTRDAYFLSKNEVKKTDRLTRPQLEAIFAPSDSSTSGNPQVVAQTLGNEIISTSRYSMKMQYAKPSVKEFGAWMLAGTYIPTYDQLALTTLSGTVALYNQNFKMLSNTRIPRVAMSVTHLSDISSKIALGDTGGHLLLYDIERERITHINNIHQSTWVSALHYKDNLGIISGGMDGDILITDPEKLVVERELKGHTLGIYCLDSAKTSKLIISGGLDRQALLWDAYCSTPIHSFEEHKAAIIYVSIDDINNTCITVASDKTVNVWDLRTFKCLQMLSDPFLHQPADNFTSSIFSSKYGRLFTAGNQIRNWDFVTADSLALKQQMKQSIIVDDGELSIEPDDKHPSRVALSSEVHSERTVKNQVEGSTPHNNTIICIDYDSKLGVFVTVDESGFILVWDLKSGSIMQSFSINLPQNSVLTTACLAANGCGLLVCDITGIIALWNFMIGKKIFQFRTLDTEIIKISPFNSGSYMGVAMCWNGKVALIPRPSVKNENLDPIDIIKAHTDDVVAHCMIQNNLCTAGRDGLIIVWQTMIPATRSVFTIPLLPDQRTNVNDNIICDGNSATMNKKAAEVISISFDNELKVLYVLSEDVKTRQILWMVNPFDINVWARPLFQLEFQAIACETATVKNQLYFILISVDGQLMKLKLNVPECLKNRKGDDPWLSYPTIEFVKTNTLLMYPLIGNKKIIYLRKLNIKGYEFFVCASEYGIIELFNIDLEVLCRFESNIKVWNEFSNISAEIMKNVNANFFLIKQLNKLERKTHEKKVLEGKAKSKNNTVENRNISNKNGSSTTKDTQHHRKHKNSEKEVNIPRLNMSRLSKMTSSTDSL